MVNDNFRGAGQSNYQGDTGKSESTQPDRFTLYGTAACHLCELAQALLRELQSSGQSLEYNLVDISESDLLFQRYGLLIPVLRHPGGGELNWPFSADQLTAFIAS